MKTEYTISRDDDVYEAFPDVAMSPKGELVCVFLECKSHGDRGNNVHLAMTKSRDGGKTWDKKKAFSDADLCRLYGFRMNCPRISTLPDGTMVVICDCIKGGEWDDGRETKIYIWRSDDCGETWSKPQILDIVGIVPDKYQVLSNGRHIFGTHRPNLHSKKLEQFAYFSDDGGKTWNETLVAADPALSLCEVSIVEIPDHPGTLVAFMRENSFIGICCKKCISHDYGTTWHGIYDTNIDACHRPVAGFYDDRHLMITYRYMQGGKGWLGSWTQNLFAAFTDVDSALATERNGQNVRIFPLFFDRNSKSDTGYSGWARLDDGSFYVVNYMLDDAPKAQIKGCNFSLCDVLLP